MSAASLQDSAALAERIAAIAADKKAIDIRVIDLRGIVSYTDFFVICSGGSERQAKAIHDAIYEELKHDKERFAARTEGNPRAAGSCSTTGTWWPTSSPRGAREYYRLESLWGEAPVRSVGWPFRPQALAAADPLDPPALPCWAARSQQPE